jgi:hypothetical protein
MSRKLIYLAFGAVLAPAAQAQVPDLINAFDAGGRALGMGGAGNTTGSETLSAYHNPAGLGYMQRKQVGIVLRNMPKAGSLVAGDLQNHHSLSTASKVGPMTLTHAGFALPLKGRNGGTNGTVALTYTTGGLVNDERFADDGLTENGTNLIPDYHQVLYNRNDFVSFGYGKSNLDQTFNYGAAILYAINHQSNLITGTSATDVNYSAKAHGWGGLFGVQFMPRRDTVIGISYRTPIKLKSDSSTPLLYDKIPGRLSGGLSWRRNMRGDDFLVLSGEVSHYFAGSRGQYFDSPAQTTWGIGAEYNYSAGGARIPVRIGYNMIPGVGNDFGSRNTFTFGFGYRPEHSDWGVDLNFARPQHGNMDMALNLMYRFGK